MRLNIRYSVDETELANEAHLLFTKAHDKFGLVKDLVVRQMMHSAVLRETDKMASSIVELRKAMLSFDTSLGEITTILEGFEAYKKGELPQQTQQTTQTQEETKKRKFKELEEKYSALGDISSLLEAMEEVDEEG